MIFYYFDTSALVKAYVQEDGTERVRAVLQEARTNPAAARVFVCSIAHPEAVSAVTRRENTRALTDFEAARAVQLIDQDFTTAHPRPYEVLDATRPVVTRAAALVRAHRLRGFDAVHLAAALALRDAAAPTVPAVRFATADKNQAAAAEAEGFPLLPLSSG